MPDWITQASLWNAQYGWALMRALWFLIAAVVVLSMDDGCVKLGARCWVPSLKYFRVRSDLTERIKQRFDQQENISLAYPQRGVHILRELDGGRRRGAGPRPEGGGHF